MIGSRRVGKRFMAFLVVIFGVLIFPQGSSVSDARSVITGQPTFEGVAISSIAMAPLTSLPEAPATMELGRLVLKADDRIPSSTAPGPELLYVEAGELTVTTPDADARVACLAGEHLLIEEGQTYRLRNDGSDDAVVLRLTLAQADGSPSSERNGAWPSPQASSDIPTRSTCGAGGAMDVPPPSESTPAASIEFSLPQIHYPQPLISADVQTLPDAPAVVFVARLSWAEGGDPGDMVFSGPVGILVETGQVQVIAPTEQTLSSCMAAVFEEQATIRMRASGEEPVEAIVVGIVTSTASPTPQSATPEVVSNGTPQAHGVLPEMDLSLLCGIPEQ